MYTQKKNVKQDRTACLSTNWSSLGWYEMVMVQGECKPTRNTL